ncbi:4720_t:CDS:1, partial [Acaulospora colombiana]
MPIALLSLQVFYATGHQATLSSLQWKSAFIFTADRGMTSPITVVLNTIGPVAFFGLCTPLIGMWAVEPFAQLESIATRKSRIIRGTLRATLSMGAYHATILLFISTCSMILRRHLMVWKVFAPRYMLGALSMVAVDVAGILAMWGGVGTVAERVDSTYKGVA